MRIVLVSDTHGLHRQLHVPSGDVLIHAGDFTLDSEPSSAVSDMSAWLVSLRHPHKMVVPGDHEFLLKEWQKREANTNAVFDG